MKEADLIELSAAKSAELQVLVDQVNGLQSTLSEIEKSKAWKLAVRFRTIKQAFFPKGSKREETLLSFYHKLKKVIVEIK